MSDVREPRRSSRHAEKQDQNSLRGVLIWGGSGIGAILVLLMVIAVLNGRGGQPKPSGIQSPAQDDPPPPLAQVPVVNIDWGSAGQVVRVGDVEVKLERADENGVARWALEFGELRDIGQKTFLYITLKNTSPTTNVRFAGWHDGKPVLSEENGNILRPFPIERGQKFYESTGMSSRAFEPLAPQILYPGKPVTGSIWFEYIGDTAKEARIRLPAEAVGGTGHIALKIAPSRPKKD